MITSFFIHFWCNNLITLSCHQWLVTSLPSSLHSYDGHFIAIFCIRYPWPYIAISGKMPSPFPSCDWRFNEFPNPTSHALHVTCVELMALPIRGEQVGEALFSVLSKRYFFMSKFPFSIFYLCCLQISKIFCFNFASIFCQVYAFLLALFTSSDISLQNLNLAPKTRA